MRNILLLFLFQSSSALAQSDIWTGNKEKLKINMEKPRGTSNKFKQWKDYLNFWGTDSTWLHALSASIKLNSNGWSGGIIYLKNKNSPSNIFWSLTFSEIKHEKETKQQQSLDFFPEFGNRRSFIFGKINYLYTIQLGYGREQLILPALLDGNMSINIRYSGGPAIAIQKPIYLNLIYTEYHPEEYSWVSSERFSAANEDRFLRQHAILGADRWTKGLNQSKLIPGLFCEGAFIIEPDKPSAFVKKISIGGNVSYYLSPLVAMAKRAAHRHQTSVFVAIDIGKRWKQRNPSHYN